MDSKASKFYLVHTENGLLEDMVGADHFALVKEESVMKKVNIMFPISEDGKKWDTYSVVGGRAKFKYNPSNGSSQSLLVCGPYNDNQWGIEIETGHYTNSIKKELRQIGGAKLVFNSSARVAAYGTSAKKFNNGLPPEEPLSEN